MDGIERKLLIEKLKKEVGIDRAMEIMESIIDPTLSLAVENYLSNTLDISDDDIKAISADNWNFLCKFLDEFEPDFQLDDEYDPDHKLIRD